MIHHNDLIQNELMSVKANFKYFTMKQKNDYFQYVTKYRRDKIFQRVCPHGRLKINVEVLSALAAK